MRREGEGGKGRGRKERGGGREEGGGGRREGEGREMGREGGRDEEEREGHVTIRSEGMRVNSSASNENIPPRMIVMDDRLRDNVSKA